MGAFSVKLLNLRMPQRTLGEAAEGPKADGDELDDVEMQDIENIPPVWGGGLEYGIWVHR